MRGRVWTAGEDGAIQIWACNDMPREAVGKQGYLYKKSPKSKVCVCVCVCVCVFENFSFIFSLFPFQIKETWQKRFFIVDVDTRELRYYADEKTKKPKVDTDTL